MGGKKALDIWCEKGAILCVRFTYFWLVIVPALDEVPCMDDPCSCDSAGRRGGRRKLPDVVRIQTRRIKLKYFFILLLNP